MDAPILIAKLMGSILLLFGFMFFIVPETSKKSRISLTQSPGEQFLYGFANLILGLYIIFTYNVWAWNIFLSVTLLGWVLTLRGIAFWYIPSLILATRATGSLYLRLFKFIVVLWGAILIWAAYQG